MRPLSLLWRFPVLVVAHLVLFSVGAALLAPPIEGAAPASSLAPLFLLAIAVVDVALLSFLVMRSRYHGWKLFALAAGFFYFVKTATSMIEAIYFMKNVTPAMLPGLLTMTLPLSIGLPALAVVVLGRGRAGADDAAEPLVAPPMTVGELVAKIVLLSAVVYPVLFFAFGYFVAWTSPAVRAFYSGDDSIVGFFEHMGNLFRTDPLVYPLEVFRGALWAVAAALVLWSTRGPRWQAALLVALSFALIQNDVHWLPNPLMPPAVRAAHFIETSTSNFLNALAIAALLLTSLSSHRRRAAAGLRGATTARAAA